MITVLFAGAGIATATGSNVGTAMETPGNVGDTGFQRKAVDIVSVSFLTGQAALSCCFHSQY